jgi:hypothetical protein
MTRCALRRLRGKRNELPAKDHAQLVAVRWHGVLDTSQKETTGLALLLKYQAAPLFCAEMARLAGQPVRFKGRRLLLIE